MTEARIDWSRAHAPTLDDIELLARDAFARLPAAFRAMTGDILFMVTDFPDEEVVAEMELESPYDILGLYAGVDLTRASHADLPLAPNAIFLYRMPILDVWLDGEESLGHLITHVLVHEIGHHFGLSDDDMDRIEQGAGG